MRLFLSVTFLYLALGSVEASQAQGYFHGYRCTVDCSGHEAGYAWAERNGLTDPDDCTGKSQSFIQGCMAYAEENRVDSEDNEEAIENGDCEDEDEDGVCD